MKRKKEFNWRLVKTCSAIFLWTTLVFFVLFVDPAFEGAIFVFLILVFIFLVFFASVLTDNMRRIFMYPFFVTLFFVFGYFGVGNVLNLFFLIGILVTLELYFRR